MTCFHTFNSRYYLNGRRCVAVWDRHTAQWQGSHSAIGADLMGTMPLLDGTLADMAQCVGRRLIFSSGIVTSTTVKLDDTPCAPTELAQNAA